ncbi:MAG: restriction endonuclease subunit S, partial [Snowella sp.]|nr:restriction endonuclease subunit S [Snowella sp.]
MVIEKGQAMKDETRQLELDMGGNGEGKNCLESRELRGGNTLKFKKLPFLEVFNDVSGGNIKTPQKDFLDQGKIPVVDQGQQLVAGYVNDQTRICKTKPPVIIFGDHTRAIKYVDFDFAMGADGIKVLVPKIESDPKFLYYVLCSLNIPNAGYSRHYKYLKETEIPLPPLDEQKRIARILDAADELRAKRRQALAELDTLLQSTFLDMFGDPVTNPK